MWRPVAALVVTAVAVALLVNYKTHPQLAANPNSALHRPPPAPPARPSPQPHAAPPGSKTATGTVLATPFSVIQVRATLTKGRLTGVETVSLTSDNSHTQALNARAEPILRAEALRAGSAHIHTVSGATTTSLSWRESLQSAIDEARRG